MNSRVKRYLVCWVMLVIVVSLSCQNDEPEQILINVPTGTLPSITTIITAVSTLGGADWTLVPGTPPSAGGGPDLTAFGNGSGIPGGSAQIALTPTGALGTYILWLPGFEGFYQVAAGGSVTIVLTISQTAFDTLTSNTFFVRYQAGLGGLFGNEVARRILLINVGTGELQVSLSFDKNSDIDLHVVEPGGEEIYYGNPIAVSGAELDLDSNAACNIDAINNENIVWPIAAAGEYIIRVDNWDSCGQEPISFIVTIQGLAGGSQTFFGNFTGAGDQGGAGSGVEIARVTF